MKHNVPDSPLVGDFRAFVETAVADPFGTKISMADFFSSGWDETEAYPQSHWLQRYVGWVASIRISDLLEDAEEDPEVRESLNELASALGVSRPGQGEEEEDQLEYDSEFIAGMADSLAETVTPQLMTDPDVVGEFNLNVVRWLGEGDLTKVDIRPPVAADEHHPVDVPSWAELLVRRGGGDRCSRCRRPLAGAGVLDYRVGLNLGGVRDVSNLRLVCEGCVSQRPDEKTVSASNF